MHQLAPEAILVFGGTGALGSAVIAAALKRKWQVTATSRTLRQTSSSEIRWIAIDPLCETISTKNLQTGAPYSSVCWAQGANATDSVYTFEVQSHLDVYKANCVYIAATLQALLEHKLLIEGARLCIISSIWQNLARQTKLSYCMSKAALQGLILSASADLAADGHLINAVLPGALDTQMTRTNLSAAQTERLSKATGFKKLATVEDVASLVCYLCSAENTGVTGQFIAVDMGYSRVRIV